MTGRNAKAANACAFRHLSENPWRSTARTARSRRYLPASLCDTPLPHLTPKHGRASCASFYYVRMSMHRVVFRLTRSGRFAETRCAPTRRSSFGTYFVRSRAARPPYDLIFTFIVAGRFRCIASDSVLSEEGKHPLRRKAYDTHTSRSRRCLLLLQIPPFRLQMTLPPNPAAIVVCAYFTRDLKWGNVLLRKPPDLAALISATF